MDALIAPEPVLLRGQGAGRRDLAGGKAAVLAELAGAFPVPAFVVVPPQAFSGGRLGERARAEVLAAAQALGGGAFAVRSSGLEEDGAAAAHAGQFETRLNVARADLTEAVEAVWRSGFSQTLAEYRRARGLSPDPQPPAVIVQVMLRPEAAGVAFTADPLTGDPDVVVVSAVRGLGDRLVSGEADGDVFRIVEATVVASDLQESSPVLSNEQAQAVAALARRLEARFGAPQDVEWAIEDGVLHLLQSRPITSLPEDDDNAVSLWDNSNIVESYPGVVSPLTFSFARRIYGSVYRAFAALMGVSAAEIAAHRPALEAMLGRAHGRVYYNLLAWYRLLSLFPGFATNRAFMEQMMGVEEPLPPALTGHIAPEVNGRWPRVVDRMRLARVGAGLAWHALVLPRTVRGFYARLEAALARPDTEIAAMSAVDLAAEYRNLERRLLEHWDAPLINDFLCMIAFGASRKALERWVGPDGAALHSEVMIGQGDIVSAEPARRIRSMGDALRGRPGLAARLEQGDLHAARDAIGLTAELEAYLAKFGDRCTEELKLESVTLHEDPSPLLAAVVQASRSANPMRVEAAADVQARLRELFPRRPVRRWAARRLLAWAKARVRDRENLRFERTRLFGRVRRIVRAGGDRLAAAGALEHGDDVFFLTIEEWLGALEGGLVGRDLKGLVALRRREDEEDRRRPDPPQRFEVRGAFLPGLERLRSRSGPAPTEGEVRSGQACCAGVVTGRVRVIADPRREALEAGEILVARHTDPGWIAVFAGAAGVIAERGSLLSHSAIVARELGTPCVVAVKGVTEWLSTGDLVRLDGGAGTVERLEG